VAVTRVRYEVEGWGVAELCTDGRRVVWHELPRRDTSRDLVPGHVRLPDTSPDLVPRLRAYFAGAEDDFSDVDLDLSELTSFGRALALALRAVPRGEVVTYGELAALAGAPGAARAAGTFCAHNRLSIFIPCHRVVAAGGIGGYGSFGSEYKQRLLALEHVSV
jgi:methylated-DNA-[protein]-cysteine S-methyltransferase